MKAKIKLLLARIRELTNQGKHVEALRVEQEKDSILAQAGVHSMYV